MKRSEIALAITCVCLGLIWGIHICLFALGRAPWWGMITIPLAAWTGGQIAYRRFGPLSK